MWASLLMDTVPFLTAGGGAALSWYMRGAMGKVRDPKPTPKDTPLLDILQRGNKVVAQMAADVHRLYHPPGEDGKPCACAMCEITADDEPAPAPEPIPDTTAFDPSYVRALQQKLDGLRKENAELRKGTGQRVVTKVTERKTALQNKIEDAMRFTSEGDIVLTLEPSDMTNGHPMKVIIGQQVEPESQVVAFGGGVVRNNYPRRPQSGPGSKELGIMDRQLGTIGSKCDRCGDKAWKYDGMRGKLCKQCWQDERTRATSDVTSVRTEGGRKYVCYRDGHCEVS